MNKNVLILNLNNVPHAEQDMLTLPEHLMSLSVFMRVRIVQALVLIVVFLFVSMFVIVSIILLLVLPSF